MLMGWSGEGLDGYEEIRGSCPLPGVGRVEVIFDRIRETVGKLLLECPVS